jgi:hypothetical protein
VDIVHQAVGEALSALTTLLPPQMMEAVTPNESMKWLKHEVSKLIFEQKRSVSACKTHPNLDLDV